MPTIWDKVVQVVIVGGILGVALGGSIFWHWWFGPVFLLFVSFCGGLMQLVRQRK
jgi:hypothetical protein